MTDQSVNLGLAQMARKSAAKRVEREGRRPSRVSVGSAPGGKVRAARQAERRDAILKAALEDSASSGFAPTRLAAVARRAGVAKGTIYLYFRDKESLFQQLVRATLSPVIGTIETAQIRDIPARAIAETIAEIF